MSSKAEELTKLAEPIHVVVLAAGRGIRMRSALPKVMHRIAGRSLVGHVLAAAAALKPAKVTVVIGRDMEQVVKAVAPATTVLQDLPQGTGHAVLAARAQLEGATGTVLVLFGDSPLLTSVTLARLVASREAGAAVAVLGFRPADPAEYGRLVQDADGKLLKIVEFKDASAAERQIPLCNAGAMAIAADQALPLLRCLNNLNAQGEYYLPDIVAHARNAGLGAAVIEADADEVLGVNTRAELASAEAQMQKRLRAAAMAGGATLIDPDTVYFSADTTLGQDVLIGPNVVFGDGVTIADNVTIHAFCHFVGTKVEKGAIIGPFARMRPGSVIGEDVHIGNFVEIKNTLLERGAKANHLSYLGDARIGAGSNIGAGTITCNYDGFGKYKTNIGAGAFIGTNAALVAPVNIGAGAYIAAGSVITEDVPADALALGRGRQAMRPGWAKEFRAQKNAEREARLKKSE